MPLLANINVGSAPNDGTGDTIREAFITVNENFQFIEAFFPNTDVANLTANITSTGTSTFNVINAATIGNAGAAFTGASISAATIGNTGAAVVGTSVSAATIGNSGAAITGSSVSAATIGNAGSYIVGTLDSTSSNQANINSIGSSITSNVTITTGNLFLPNTALEYVRSIRSTVAVSTGGSYNIGFGLSNTQVVSFFMNSNVTLTLIGTIESGIQKDYYFINNSGSTQYANIFVLGNRTNKGTNLIAVSSNTTALIKMLAIDSTADNLVAIISNV